MKICSHCKVEKPLEDFYKNRSIQGGLKGECKSCSLKYSKDYRKTPGSRRLQAICNARYYKKNPSRLMNNHLRRSYGITLEQKLKMVKNQNNKCAICENEFKNTRDANVDHNHNTKQVRDILCYRCNIRLGILEDTIFFEKAMKYLEKHTKK